MNNSLVSVIMPVYNADNYLNDAIDSILNQTYTNIELIIIDDCSTDNSAEIIKSYNDCRIRSYFNTENLQQSRTRNKGFELANGDYIANMDSDDISCSNRLKEQVEFMEKNNDIDVCGCYYKTFGGGKCNIVKTPLSNEDCKMASIFTSPVAHPSVMIRRSSFEKYNIQYDPEYKYSQDFELWSRLLFKGAKFSNIPKVLLNYRENPTGVTYGHSDESKKYTEKVIIRNLKLLFGDCNNFDEIYKCSADLNNLKKCISELAELIGKPNSHNFNKKQTKYVIDSIIISIVNKCETYDFELLRILILQIGINKKNFLWIVKLIVKACLCHLKLYNVRKYS